MRANARMDKPDLILAQVVRRVALAQRPDPSTIEAEATIETLASLVVLGIAVAFLVLVWVLG